MDELEITRVLKILDTSKVGVLEWKFHRNSLVIDASLFSILQESAQENISGLHSFLLRIHSSDRKKALSAIRACIQEGTCIDIKLRLRNAHGEYIWIQARGNLHRDKSGNPEFLTATMTDISHECFIAEQLQLSEERLKQAPEFANISLWEVYAEYGKDDVKRTFWWSASFYQILGYSSQDLEQTEQQFYALMHPEDLIYLKQEVKTMVDQNLQSTTLEFRLKHRTQGYIWVRSIGRRQQLENNTFKSLGVIININDLKLAQHETKIKNLKLQQTNQDLEHFAYAASHDLKAPLRGIKSLAAWIQEDIENPTESIKQNLNLMTKRVMRMENLLADILTYSRAGRLNQEPEKVYLGNLIQEIWDCASPPANFQIRTDLQPASLQTSKTRIEQVLSNLILNAIKHHDKEQGLIEVSYRIEQGQHCFSVTDDGPGIEPVFKDKIFQIFQTLRPRDEVEGSGVGLAIVKKTIDAAGGSVWLSSTSNQRGASFNFTLPLDEGRITAKGNR